MGSQMGKTDSQVNALGHRLDSDPVPVMYIGPTRKFVERVWEPRFMAMVLSTPLAQKIALGRQPKTVKKIANVDATFGWAGSASELAGQNACKVMVDERDRMDDNIKGEGDPVEMADGRHVTYSDGQTGIFSTPTIGTIETEVHAVTGLEHWAISDDLGSATWKIWQEGTRHEWMVRCVEKKCREYFAPRFRYLSWPDRKSAEDLVEDDVGLCCFHCGTIISHKQREMLLESGRAVAPGQWVDENGDVKGDAPYSLTYSQWTSGLCSPWRDWFTMARRWLAAVRSGDPERVQGVLNIQFGELYSFNSEAPEWQKVAELRTLIDYRMGELGADNPIEIVMGVDVQKDRLIYVIRSYHSYMQSFLIDHGEIYSNSESGTEAEDVWKALAEFQDRQFGDYAISRVFIDSRYRTPVVFSFVRRHKGWAFPCVGLESADKPLTRKKVDVTRGGKIRKGGLSRWAIDSDFFKRWIHARLERDRDMEGQFHLPIDATDDYCKQLVAEARIVKPSGKVVWVRIRRDNHYLDCEMMALACAYSLQTHIKADKPPMSSNVVRGGRSVPKKKEPVRMRKSKEKKVRSHSKSWYKPRS